MTRIFTFLFLSVCTLTFAQEYDIKVSYVKLNKGEEQPIKTFATNTDPNARVMHKDQIVIVPEMEFQTIEGIGGAFNENGGEALLSLPKEKQENLLNNLFSLDKAGFVFNRTPIGASDFSMSSYSYSETPEDFRMRKFSIDRDKKHLLPYIKAALKVNPDILLQASPWSPPAWMKESNSIDANDKNKKKSRLRKDPKIYAAYALYLTKYIKAYKKCGVTIDRFCVQNEPDTYANFPGNNMSMGQMEDLSLNYIIPKFKEERLSTGIYAGTFRTIDRGDHYKILNKNTLGKFDGIGFQYARQPFMSEVQLLEPGLKMINTETNCFRGANSEKEAKTRMAEIANYINAGTSNYCYWNIILNETSTSAWNWKQNSLVIVDRNTGDIQFTPDYNALYLASNAIRANDKRIAHISRHPMVSTKNKDGEIKLLIQNDEMKDRFYRLLIDETKTTIQLPKDAMCLITLTPKK